jgi:hypothetical protein
MMGGSPLLTIGMVVMMVVMMGGMIGGSVLALGRRARDGRRDRVSEPPADEQEQALKAADGGS